MAAMSTFSLMTAMCTGVWRRIQGAQPLVRLANAELLIQICRHTGHACSSCGQKEAMLMVLPLPPDATAACGSTVGAHLP